MNDLLRRQTATNATMDRYRHKKFSWAARATCVHMVRFHLRKMGHKLPPIPDLRSLFGARRALDVRGWGDVGQMMDTVLPAIAPAAMLLGDVVMMHDDSGLGGLFISVGHKVIGWHEEAPAMVTLVPLEIQRAWRA